MSSNRKKSARGLLNYPATIVANDGSWGRDCRLVDVSDGGARLVTESPVEVPADFTLSLPGKIARRCHLKWTDDCEIGVLFVR